MGDIINVEFVEIQGDFDTIENLDIFLEIYISESAKNLKIFNAIIFVFDVNNMNTLHNTAKWLKWLHNCVKKTIFQ